MVVEAQERSGSQGRYRPHMATWTQEASMLAVVVDKLTSLERTLMAVNGNNAGSFVPYPRPKTAIDKVREDRRQTQHQRLVAMLLPHKRKE